VNLDDVWFTFWLVKVFSSFYLSLYDPTISYTSCLDNCPLIKFREMEKQSLNKLTWSSKFENDQNQSLNKLTWSSKFAQLKHLGLKVLLSKSLEMEKHLDCLWSINKFVIWIEFSFFDFLKHFSAWIFFFLKYQQFEIIFFL
jgi:hypothetical protein